MSRTSASAARIWSRRRSPAAAARRSASARAFRSIRSVRSALTATLLAVLSLAPVAPARAPVAPRQPVLMIYANLPVYDQPSAQARLVGRLHANRPLTGETTRVPLLGQRTDG